uniref:ATP synthase complex subunit 8 n=1 Tax=Amorophaga japonica TaxID=1454529 RepID=A0A6M6CYR4_9NEOP|nr:ATP synthase F0 subunit 8 [Amorophaga japonica]
MPQMMPMNWIMLILFFMIIFYLFNIMNYYNFKIINKSIMKNNKNFFKTNLIWKW